MDDVAPSENRGESETPPPRSRRGLLVAALLACIGLATLAIVLPIGALLLMDVPIRVPQVEFDRGVWCGVGPEAGGSDRTRQRMTDDLMETHLELGMSKGTVVELLGPPSSELYRGRVLHYWVGPARVVFPVLEAEFLRIELDERGTVVAVDLIELD